MALTQDFKQTVVARVRRDSAFAKGLLDETATLFLNGEQDMAGLILRDLVNPSRWPDRGTGGDRIARVRAR